jgi:hypothetical protein
LRTLASLDALSEGRLKVVIGVGWQPQDFAVLDSDPRTRGRRTDTIFVILPQVWASGSSAFSGDYYSFPDVRITPPPAHRILIWIAGSSWAAHDRAVRLGDGFHGLPTRNEPVTYHLQCDVSTVPATVKEMRRTRPATDDFTVSHYTHDWDPGEFNADVIRCERDFFVEAGGTARRGCLPAARRRLVDALRRAAGGYPRYVMAKRVRSRTGKPARSTTRCT